MPDRDEALKALRSLSEHDLKVVIGEIVLDPRVRRREGFKGWYYRYAGSIAFAFMIALTTAGFFYVQHQNDTIRSGLIRGCEQNGNPLRVAVQGELQAQIQQSRSPLLEKFFPQIPPKQLHELIQAENQKRREEIAQIAPVDCPSLYR